MTLSIPANDHGALYIFALDAAPDIDPSEDEGAAFGRLLGTEGLDADYIDLIETTDLGEMSVADYLTTGYDVDLSRTDRSMANRLSGSIMLVMSRAFADQPARLTPQPGITHALTIRPEATLERQPPLESAAAQGVLDGGDMPDDGPQRPSRIYWYALILIFAIFALMAWRIASGNV